MGLIFKNGVVYGSASPEIASFTVGTMTLSASNWTSGTGEYTQTPTLLVDIDEDSKVDLQPDSTTIVQMIEDGTIALYAVNTNGIVVVHAVGEAPTENLSVQYTVLDQLEIAEGSAF